MKVHELGSISSLLVVSPHKWVVFHPLYTFKKTRGLCFIAQKGFFFRPGRLGVRGRPYLFDGFGCAILGCGWKTWPKHLLPNGGLMVNYHEKNSTHIEQIHGEWVLVYFFS